jgi:phosphate transport system substrate-binding protein
MTAIGKKMERHGFWVRRAFASLMMLGVWAAWPETAAAGEVRIVRSDGSEVTGALSSFDDGVYVIATAKGEVRVEAGKVAKLEVLGAPKPAAQSDTSPAPQSSSPQSSSTQPSPPKPAAPAALTLNQTVTITTTQKEHVVGRLISFEDGYYEIETVAGVLRVAIANVSAINPAATAMSVPNAPPKGPQPDLNGGSLSLSGSRALGEMAIRQLIEAYALMGGATKPVWGQRNAGNDRTFVAQTGKDTTFSAEVKLRGTAGGVEDLISGAAEIAMLERPMTADEAKRVTSAGLGDPLQPSQEALIGPSAVVVLTHPSNPVKSLSIAQMSDIFSGRVRNWNEVGGTNRRIQVLVPNPGSALFDAVKAATGKAFDVLPSARRVAASIETADLVGADPAAIGLAHSDYRGNAVAVSLTTQCGIIFEPSDFQIASESYPFGSRLVLYTTNKASKQVKDFVAYAQSSSAQRMLQDKGYVSLTPILAPKGSVKFDRTTAAKMSGASARFTDVVGAFVESAARLSLTFRFDAQGALDARGQSDLDRLAEHAKSGALANRKLSLVGYWDSTGDFTDDVAQSKARAVMVAEALKKKGLIIERLFGFGPLLPVECDGAGGTHRNRRVEVWVE